jgi:hypothetical protein
VHVFKLRRECFEEGLAPVGGGAGGVSSEPAVPAIAPPADAPYVAVLRYCCDNALML